MDYDGVGIALFFIISYAVVLFIMYYVFKAAIKNGTIAALKAYWGDNPPKQIVSNSDPSPSFSKMSSSEKKEKP
ncbi:MAG: hypothetical protein KJI72_04055 [Patescibacteria group bacterium]|nr:hypothetical protein [Patescibacteria group bacterium]